MSLQEIAKELGVEFDDGVSEEALQKLVNDKKEELESNITYWKEQATKWETEAKTAFGKRDQFKKDKEDLSKKIKNLEKDMKDMIPSDEKTKLSEELKELKKFKSDIDKQKEEDELAQKTEVERLQIQMSKQQDDFQKQLDEKITGVMKDVETKDKQIQDSIKEIESLRFNGLEAEIVKEAAKLDAWSPSQIFLLTKDKFTYDKNLGKFSYQNREAGTNKLLDEMSVGEFIDDFLKQEQNENLIKSRVNTQSFRTDKDKTQEKTKGDLGTYNPKDPDIIRKAELNSMSPERYIKVVMIPKDSLKNRGKDKE